MANTQRTDYELLSLFADNNIGGITAQDLRDLVVSKVNIENQIGQLSFQGGWDADTNTPSLSSGTGNTGDFYIVTVDGTTNLDGNQVWSVGDWAIFDGSVWIRAERVDYATEAGESALEAKHWAIYPEDTLVPEGDGIYDYSALHHRIKTEEAEAKVAPYYSDIETVSTNIADVQITATNIDNVNTVANDLNETVSEIDAVANSIENVDLTGQNIDSVNTVATDITNVNTAATNIADVNTVAGSITNVNNVGNDITNVNTTATNITDVNTIATDLNLVDSNIETVATNIVNVNATGSDIANVNTVATDIANVNTTATNITDVNTVATNITDIQNTEENALESKNWANYPVDQLVPEGDLVDDYSALHHATKASESAQAAAASYDSFDDRYLGAKSTDPTTDNDGDPLVVGALYFNSTENEMRVWEGTNWKTSTIYVEDSLTSTSTQATLSANQGRVLNTQHIALRETHAELDINPIIYDDFGDANCMVRIPKFKLEYIDASLGTGVHPAFIVNGVEKDAIYYGQYPASVKGSNYVSIPNADPATGINHLEALLACAAKGNGWHLSTNAEWMALTLWAWKNGTMPHGNNNYGRDIYYKHETGRLTDPAAILGDSGTARTATGTGPATWAHDHTMHGVHDMNGNVWEWQGGLRIIDGEIQILADNNAADNTKDQSATSSEWKAILQDGSLVTPGTSGTLKYDATGTNGAGSPILNTALTSQSTGSEYSYAYFRSLSAETGVSVPALMIALGMYPVGTGLGGDRIYVRNVGERLPSRGCHWGSSTNAGVFSLYLNNDRTALRSDIGFRPAFVI